MHLFYASPVLNSSVLTTPVNLHPGSRPVPNSPEYELVKRLGAGGFGDVWHARGPGGVDVAVKFIRLDTGYRDIELRSLGPGRGCLPRLLEDRRNGERTSISHEPEQLRTVPQLFVRYARVGTTLGERLNRTIWTWFFNDNDFVSEGRDPREPEPPFVRLIRVLRKRGQSCPRDAAPGSSAGSGSPPKPSDQRGYC